MQLFHEIEHHNVILQSRGVYRQAKLYRRSGELYAGWAGGFVRLINKGGTSKPDVTWIDMDYKYSVGQFDRLMLTGEGLRKAA